MIATAFRIGVAVTSVALAHTAAALEACGELRNSFGPWDYRAAPKAALENVETNHFDTGVEGLAKGVTGSLGGDLSYTLRVFPNHPRALLAMMRLSFKENREKPRGSIYTVECWFDRAVRFTPNDASVRVLYGVYLIRKGDKNEAVTQLKEAEGLAGDDPNVPYNLGLAYFDLGDYDKALEQAHRAYALGFPLPGLRHKLQEAGRWRDPVSSAVGPQQEAATRDGSLPSKKE